MFDLVVTPDCYCSHRHFSWLTRLRYRMDGPLSYHQFHYHVLPRCYQDRTNQPHLHPLREYPALWFLVGLGCLRRVKIALSRFCKQQVGCSIPLAWSVPPFITLSPSTNLPERL